jgi:hypothetical protein
VSVGRQRSASQRNAPCATRRPSNQSQPSDRLCRGRHGSRSPLWGYPGKRPGARSRNRLVGLDLADRKRLKTAEAYKTATLATLMAGRSFPRPSALARARSARTSSHFCLVWPFDALKKRWLEQPLRRAEPGTLRAVQSVPTSLGRHRASQNSTAQPSLARKLSSMAGMEPFC